jgi:lipoprotein signal peptidase
MVAHVIITCNIVVALLTWAPAVWRIIRRRSSKAYSLTTMLMVLWLQASNCGIALSRGQQWATLWFGCNGLIVATVCFIVWRYRDGK